MPHAICAFEGTSMMFVLIFDLSTIVCADFGRLGYSGCLTPPRTSSTSMFYQFAQTFARVLRRALAAATNGARANRTTVSAIIIIFTTFAHVPYTRIALLLGSQTSCPRSPS